jgi:hypothetical protein
VNPWAIVIAGLGVLIIIMGVKGSYGNVVSALKSGGTRTTSASHSPVRPTLV